SAFEHEPWLVELEPRRSDRVRRQRTSLRELHEPARDRPVSAAGTERDDSRRGDQKTSERQYQQHCGRAERPAEEHALHARALLTRNAESATPPARYEAPPTASMIAPPSC